jgi:hypothetical protein
MSTQNRLVKVQFDFEGSMPDEMRVREGDVLMARPCEGDEWLMAVKLRTEDGEMVSIEHGLVPSSFVQDHTPEADEWKACQASYAYQGRDENELTVEEGEGLEAIHPIGEQWMVCRNREGSLGLVPSNYVSHSNAAANPQSEDDEQADEEVYYEAEEAAADVKSPTSIPFAPPMPPHPSNDHQRGEEKRTEEPRHRSAEESPKAEDNLDSTAERIMRCPEPQNLQSKKSQTSSGVQANWVKPVTGNLQPTGPTPGKRQNMQSTPSPSNEADIVKATPPPESQRFQLPPVQLKKMAMAAAPKDSVSYLPGKKASKGPQVTELSSPQSQSPKMQTAVTENAIVLSLKDKRKDNKPAREMRMWTDMTGQFRMEARYDGLNAGQAALVKANGSRVTVPVDKLCSRDMEYIYGQEGLPLPDHLVKRSNGDMGHDEEYMVRGFDWLRFMIDAGMGSERARRYATAIARQGLGERDAGAIDRSWMAHHDFDAVDAIAIEKHLGRLHSAANMQTLEDRMLEAIDKLNVRVESALVPRSQQGTGKGRPRQLDDYSDDDYDDGDNPSSYSTGDGGRRHHGRPQHPRERIVYESNKMRPDELLDLVSPPPAPTSRRTSTTTVKYEYAAAAAPMPQPNYGYGPAPSQMVMYQAPPPPPPPQMIMPMVYQAPPPPPPPQVVMMSYPVQAAPPQPIYYGQPPPQSVYPPHSQPYPPPYYNYHQPR